MVFNNLHSIVMKLKASKVTFNFARNQHKLLTISVLMVMTYNYQAVSWHPHLHAKLRKSNWRYSFLRHIKSTQY